MYMRYSVYPNGDFTGSGRELNVLRTFACRCLCAKGVDAVKPDQTGVVSARVAPEGRLLPQSHSLYDLYPFVCALNSMRMTLLH